MSNCSFRGFMSRHYVSIGVTTLMGLLFFIIEISSTTTMMNKDAITSISKKKKSYFSSNEICASLSFLNFPSASSLWDMNFAKDPQSIAHYKIAEIISNARQKPLGSENNARTIISYFTSKIFQKRNVAYSTY